MGDMNIAMISDNTLTENFNCTSQGLPTMPFAHPAKWSVSSPKDHLSSKTWRGCLSVQPQDNERKKVRNKAALSRSHRIARFVCVVYWCPSMASGKC